MFCQHYAHHERDSKTTLKPKNEPLKPIIKSLTKQKLTMETVSIVLLIILLSTIFNVISGIALFCICDRKITPTLFFSTFFWGLILNVILSAGFIFFIIISGILAHLSNESITEVIKNA